MLVQMIFVTKNFFYFFLLRVFYFLNFFPIFSIKCFLTEFTNEKAIIICFSKNTSYICVSKIPQAATGYWDESHLENLQWKQFLICL